MKIKLLFLSLIISTSVFAQSEGPNSPLMATYSAIGCLACPGAEWNNWLNVTAADGMYADVSLNSFPNCFQTSCYYSRYLMASNFDFAIPANATITGIQAEILRMTSAASIIKDSIVQIFTSINAGTNHADTSAWTSSPVNITYGGSTDLWGLLLTPASVNDVNFGVQVMIRNGSAQAALLPSSIDHMQMTVYYSLPTGTYSQTKTPGELTLYPNPAASEFTISNSRFPILKVEIYNLTGERILSQPQTSSFKPETSVDISQLSPGIYFVVINAGTEKIKRKFIKSEY